ncbi:MAG TPA: DUF6622 family protein [Rhodocyclaceae bacterium]|nr:DUF6622 family protein [Rhodocyclaceae bacterium]
MIQFLQHVPLWVYGVFLFLVAAGVSQLRDRSVSARRAVLMPLAMMLWSASKLVTSPQTASTAGLAWGLALGFSLLICLLAGYPRGIAMEASGRSLRMSGSALPLVLMMLVFVVRFVATALAIRQPQLAASAPFASGFGLVYGLISGIFFARAIGVLRVVWRERRTASLSSQQA